MMLRLWKWYQKCLDVHPVKTQIISSGFLWGLGDVTAQAINHSTMQKHHQNSLVDKDPERAIPLFWAAINAGDRVDSALKDMAIVMKQQNRAEEAIEAIKSLRSRCSDQAQESLDNILLDLYKQDADEFKIKWKRVAITSIFGFGFVGPVGHFWYLGLDRVIRSRLQLQPKSLRFVATKVAMDGIIYGPFDLFVFFTYMGFSMGKSVEQVTEDVKRDFLPALMLEGGFCAFVQVANFRFVPVKYQLLYMNTFCLLDCAFLSWIEQQQDAPWKQWLTSFLVWEEREGRR